MAVPAVCTSIPSKRPPKDTTMQTGVAVTEARNPISAQKPKRKGGQHYVRKARRGGHNVIWRRITAAFDDELKKFGANPAMVAPLSRWVLFEHLNRTQGAAGRYYADVMRNYSRFYMEKTARSPRSANLEPSTSGADQEIQRRILDGSIEDYEREARYAKQQYRRCMKVLGRFADPITGRNIAKDRIDTLCLADQEPPAQDRKDISIVLDALAKEFGLGDYKPQRKVN